MFEEVNTNELLSIISTFHKDKILSPNGWTLEFYLGFFEFLGEDLLRVVEKVRVLGRY
jgi:hypothetical protein